MLPLRLCALLLVLSVARPAAADDRFIFLVDDVVYKVDGLSPTLRTAIESRLARSIAKHKRLTNALPEGAPPREKPKALKKYLARKKRRAFSLRVEVLEFSTKESASDGKKWLAATLSLRLSGITEPGRSFAFTGNGKATVQIELFSAARDKDRAVAAKEALDVAAETAFQEAFRKLQAPPPGKKRKKRRR